MIPRLFLDEVPGERSAVRLSGEVAHYLDRVLRLRPGDRIVLIPGRDEEWPATLEAVSRKEAVARVTGAVTVRREPPVDITLVQGLPKGDKMDLVVQKATELGVARIVPVTTERSVVRLDEDRAEHRRSRWQAIAREAAEQSGRTVVPDVAPVQDFEDWVVHEGFDGLGIMLWEAESNAGLKSAIEEWLLPDGGGHAWHEGGRAWKQGDAKRPAISLVVGPEGGFTEHEAGLVMVNGGLTASLGPRILRTETAGLAAIAAVLYHIGDLGSGGDR